MKVEHFTDSQQGYGYVTTIVWSQEDTKARKQTLVQMKVRTEQEIENSKKTLEELPLRIKQSEEFITDIEKEMVIIEEVTKEETPDASNS